jgi:hypothetical protein
MDATATVNPVTAGSSGADGPPRRIQLRRKRGWRKPANTVVVSRPGKWGNPFVVTADYPVESAVRDYEQWLTGDAKGMQTLAAAKAELRGRNLACWCRPGWPCHADVLLKLVNE